MENKLTVTENNLTVTPNNEQDIAVLNDQFGEFLHTKGIKAKFKLAFENMEDSARRQHEIDKANFEEVKARSAEENKDFVEFLHTKGLKAKTNLVIENIKRGAAENRANRSARIKGAEHPAQLTAPTNDLPVSAQTLSDAFNEFLKEKGLDGQYSVTVTEEINE